MADLAPGVPNALRPLVRRIVTPSGTNTYLLGIDEIAVVDPGTDDPGHLEAIVGCGGDRIRWILATSAAHGHADGASALHSLTGAEVLAMAAPGRPRPHQLIGDGHLLEATEFRLAALHMPEVTPDHLCYLLEDDRILLAGDLLYGDDGGPPVPAGTDRAGYQTAIERLAKLRPPLRGIGPGHGTFIDDATAALARGPRAA